MFKISITLVNDSTEKVLVLENYDLPDFIKYMNKFFNLNEYRINFIQYLEEKE